MGCELLLLIAVIFRSVIDGHATSALCCPSWCLKEIFKLVLVPGELAQAEDLLHGQVPDADLPVEGDQVVLAQREELDVPDDHHLVGLLVEDALKVGKVRNSIGLIVILRCGAVAKLSKAATVE